MGMACSRCGHNLGDFDVMRHKCRYPPIRTPFTGDTGMTMPRVDRSPLTYYGAVVREMREVTFYAITRGRTEEEARQKLLAGDWTDEGKANVEHRGMRRVDRIEER